MFWDFSPDIILVIKDDEMVEHLSRVMERRDTYRVLVGKH